MPVVDVDGLTFTYASGTAPAVRDLRFSIDGGEIFGFLGPNGAGKSTTQKLLIGLLRGYRGAVSVLGRDLADRRADYYERIGVSFELPNHYLRLTGLENLRYFRALYRGDTREPEALLEAGEPRVVLYFLAGLGCQGGLIALLLRRFKTVIAR